MRRVASQLRRRGPFDDREELRHTPDVPFRIRIDAGTVLLKSTPAQNGSL
jgi:hypothetical protein